MKRILDQLIKAPAVARERVFEPVKGEAKISGEDHVSYEPYTKKKEE